MINYILIIVGFAILMKGADFFVGSASKIAKRFGIPTIIIGLTIVSIGTSAPELSVSIISALKGSADIAAGNVIGSNIFNILLILPISAFINPIKFNSNFNQDIWILIGGTIFLIGAIAFSTSKKVTRWHGIVLLGFYCLYTAYLVSKEL